MTTGLYRDSSPEERRKYRAERLGDVWETYGKSCLPLAQPSKSLCKIRSSFETPEARYSFCLGAYRPTEDPMEIDDVVAEPEVDVRTYLRQASLRQASSLPPTGRDAILQRTDAPLSRFAPVRDITSQRRYSKSAAGANVAVEEHRMSVDLNSRRYSAPPCLSIDQMWEATVTPRATVNPFNNIPDTEGFFQ